MSVATAYRRWQQERQIKARVRVRAAERQRQVTEDRIYEDYRRAAPWFGATAQSCEEWDRENEERRRLSAEARIRNRPPLWATVITALVLLVLAIGVVALKELMTGSVERRGDRGVPFTP